MRRAGKRLEVLRRARLRPTLTEVSAAYNRVTAVLSSLDALTAISKVPLVVVESPFRGLRNAEVYAEAACWDCMQRGEAPFASHLLYTRFLKDEDPQQREIGMVLGRAWIRAADYMAVYDDFGVSEGMSIAIALALGLGKPVKYRKLGRPADEDI
jgi:hypothetical protein